MLTNRRMYRAFLLYGELRYIYPLPYPEAIEPLDASLAWASRSRLKPFIKLALTILKHRLRALLDQDRNQQLAPVSTEQQVRLLSHRAY